MGTMTPREQIEWIQADAREFCMTRCRDRPKLVYAASTSDVHAMQRDMNRLTDAVSDSFEIETAAGRVKVIGGASQRKGLTPLRMFRCPCGGLSLDDSSGRCVGCQMAQVAQTSAAAPECRRTHGSKTKIEPAEIAFGTPGAGSLDYSAAFRGVDRSESPRPDGFAQSKIDEIKTTLTQSSMPVAPPINSKP